MANLTNPFDLLGDDDTEDPSQLIAAAQQKTVVSVDKKSGSQQVHHKKPALLPTKPLPPSQAVQESKNGGGRGAGRAGGRGRGCGRGGRGFNRDSGDGNSFRSGGGDPVAIKGETGKSFDRFERHGPRGPHHGGLRGGFNNIEDEGDQPRRVFERHSGTGHGSGIKREGAGRVNWGTPTDDFPQVTEDVLYESEKNLGYEKPVGEGANNAIKDNANETEGQEPEEKEMTLEEYEKVLEEKRKALEALKTAEHRKVDTKEFESMQLLSNKKENGDVFIKLGFQKDKQKEATEKDEKAKKSLSINEFLKPAEGESYYRPGGRGHGRGCDSRTRGFGDRYTGNIAAPSIEDPGHFPTLGAK